MTTLRQAAWNVVNAWRSSSISDPDPLPLREAIEELVDTLNPQSPPVDAATRRATCRTCGGAAYQPMDYGSGRQQARRCSGCHKIVGRCSCAPVATS